MEINISVNCTPMEARVFFGLPDVKPLQDHLLQEFEERLRTTLKMTDIDNFLQTLLQGNSLLELGKIQTALIKQFIVALGHESDTQKNCSHNNKV